MLFRRSEKREYTYTLADQNIAKLLGIDISVST